MSYNKPMIHCSPTQQWSCDSVVQELSTCRFEKTTIGTTIRNRQQRRIPSWITAGTSPVIKQILWSSLTGIFPVMALSQLPVP
jgi:hypothetical protein